MVTRGQRQLGKTIRKLESSVEFSTKESMAKQSEKKYKENAQKSSEDSPVKSLRKFS
jgi:hypothetical protein